MFPAIKALSAIILFFLTTAVWSSEQASYRNRKFGFAFEYPSSYQLHEYGISIDLIDSKENNKIFGHVLELDECIEKNRYFFKLLFFIDKFRSCAIDIARDWCYADGPDGDSYCTTVTDETRYASKYGVPVIQLHFVNISEYYEDGIMTKRKKIVGPVFIADISKDAGHQRALIFNLANDRPMDKLEYRTTRDIIRTVKLEN